MNCFLKDDSSQVASPDVFRAKNSSFLRHVESATIRNVRDVGRTPVLLFALVLNLATSEIGVGADWPQNYIVHKNSESPDGRYGVVVLSSLLFLPQTKTRSR
jgi:hypothetical protein